MKKLMRGLVYILGLAILALGITLNTKTSLGVSPLISVPYAISQIAMLNFANTVLVYYSLLAIAEVIMHCLTVEKSRKVGRVCADLLQIPLSVVFTRFMNVFSVYLPELATDCAGSFWGTMAGRILMLILAVVLTGIGASMSVNMRLIPNPGDGIVQTISDVTGKSQGLTKNCFDVCSVAVTLAIGLIGVRRIVGIGLGTLIAVLGVGRVMAAFQHFTGRWMAELAGEKA